MNQIASPNRLRIIQAPFTPTPYSPWRIRRSNRWSWDGYANL